MRSSPSRKTRQRPATKGVPSAQSLEPHYTSLSPPTQICCFICNSNYLTRVSSGDVCQLSVTRILTFCDLFSLRDEVERQCLLRLAYLNDPFCAACSQKMNQLQDWVGQLDALQKGIDSLKSDVGLLMVNSYPDSPNIEGTHHIKTKLVGVWNSVSSQDHTKDAGSFQPFQDLVQAAHLTGTCQRNLQSQTQTETQYQIVEFEANSDDAYFDDGVEDNSNHSSEPEPKKTRSSWKKPKRTRESSIRQSPAEKIEAHPDGHCRLCPSTFNSQVQLAKHIRRSHSGIVHPCRYCDKSFHDTSNRKRHEISVHINQTRDFVCEKCGKDYRTPFMLRAHVQVVHEGKILKQYRKQPSQCHECGKVCTNLKNLRTHVRVVHGDVRRRPCTICGRPFKDPQHLKRHERTHFSASDLLNEGKTYYYKCTICPNEGQMGFRAKVALEEHYATEHPTTPKPKLETRPMKKSTEEGFMCPDCPFHKPFTRKEALERHMNTGHGSKKGLAGRHGRNCKICGKPCRNSTRAVEHQGTHHSRAYVCTVCPFSDSRKHNIIDHYARKHPRVKRPKLRTLLNSPYKQYFCPDCPEHPGFSKKERMRAHMKAHRLGTLDELDESEEYKVKEETEEEEEEEDIDVKPKTGSDDGEDDESEDSWRETKKIRRRPVSRRERVLKLSQRFRTSVSRLRSLRLEKELQISLERVDQNWSPGKVRSVKIPVDQLSDPYEDPLYKGDGDQGYEEPPFLVTVEHSLQHDGVSMPFFDESLPSIPEDYIIP